MQLGRTPVLGRDRHEEADRLAVTFDDDESSPDAISAVAGGPGSHELRDLTSSSPSDHYCSHNPVIVASRDHARRGVSAGFVMANHGKRAPLLKPCTCGDGIMIHSPTTTYPDGDRLRAITIVGTVTGADVEPTALLTSAGER